MSKGKRQQFVCVATDVWDGKSRKINGITIFFVNPFTMSVVSIPIALTPPLWETALSLCKTCMLGLDQVGLEMQDMFRAVNDNCATAIKAGNL